jgi:hypothetical protein
MASKIKLFLLECEDTNPDFIRRVDVADAERYASLCFRLKEFGVVDWPFNFWEVEAKYMTQKTGTGSVLHKRAKCIGRICRC